MDLPAQSLAGGNWSQSSSARQHAGGEGPARFNFEELFADEYERMLRLAYLIVGSRPR